MKLHPVQDRLLALLKRKKGDVEELSLRKIGALIDVPDKPQIIAHHLSQLEEKGYLRRESPDSKKYTILKEPVSGVVWVNLYGYAECGPDGMLGDDEVMDKIPLSSKTFHIANPDDYFLIKARGKSMEPTINNGDIVLAKKQTQVDSGSLAVVIHNDMPKIKKIMTNSNGSYCLISINPEYAKEDVLEEGSSLRVVGLVKSIIRASAS